MTPARRCLRPTDDRVLRLERLRQEVESWSWQAGSLGDYLDLGNPSPARAVQARAIMQASEKSAEDARQRLIELLATTRAESPAAVADWTSLHMAILRRILREPDPGPAGAGSDRSVRLYVARETLTKWRRVARGEDEVVLINRGYLEDYGIEVDAWVEQAKPL